MADAESNIRIDIDTSGGVASLKALQREISAFHTAMAKGSAAMAQTSANLQRDLVNNINATKQFSASMATVRSGTESFTRALESNKLSMGQYFKYAGASTQTFGKLFRSEFDTIEKVARERVKTLQTQYIKMGRDANGAIKAIAVRPLALDMENLATKTQMAAMKQQLFNQLMKQGSTNLLNFGKNTQWAGRQLMVGFTVPLTYLGVAAGKTFMQMEEQVIKFKRVYGEMFTTASETDKMVNDIQNLAKEFTKYGVAVVDTMEMAAKAASMGKMGADLIEQVNSATKLAILGNVEQAQALETTISITNAFGVTAEKLAGKINFLNAVENQTVVSIEDLTEAIPKAGPVVQQLGGDVEDLAFFLTAMKEGGINASEGANALKSGLASLINPTGKASEMLAQMGINIKGIVEANKGDVKSTVIDFAKALDTLDPLNRARAIEQLFGKFQFSRLSTLFQNVVKEGSQASRVLELTNATAEELAILSERELKRVEDSPMYKFQKAVEDLKVSLVPLGEAFVKAVTPIVEFAKDVLERFNALDEGAKSFIVGLTAVLGVIGPVALMAFGLIANGAANIIKLFQGIGSIFGRVSGDSKNLGVSTQYMTQEQLEAESVAASLNQTHARLIQTFTSEAGALDKLTAAYTRSLAAQAKAMPGMAVKGVSAKKYADGVVSVPGPKGAGDIIPAMLAPGEAVIPAKLAEKYAPLIGAMVSGGIPGFQDGNVKAYTNSTMFLPKELNSALNTGTANPKALSAAITSGGQAATSPLLTEIVRSMGFGSQSQIKKAMSDPNIQKELKRFSAGFSYRLAEEVGKIKGPVSDKQFATIANRIATEEATKRSEAFQKATAKTLKQVTTYEDSTRIRLDKDGKPRAAGRAQLFSGLTSYKNQRDNYAANAQTMGLSGKIAPNAVMAHITEPIKATIKKLATMGKLTDTAKKSGELAAAGKKEVYREGAPGKRAVVPAKATRQEMADAVDGKTTAKTTADTAKTEAKTAKTRATTTKTEEKTAKARSTTVKTESSNAKKTQAAVNSEARSAAAKKGWETRKANAAQQTAAVAPATGGRMAGKLGGAATAVSMVAMGASMMGGPVGEAAGQVAGPLMMVGMLFQMLPAPIAAAVSAIGLVAVAGFALKGAFDKAQDSAMKLGMALGTGEDAVRSYAEFAGNVTAGEVMDKRRQGELSMFQVQTGKTTFGESFMQGEQGKSLLDSARQGITTSGVAPTQDAIVSQMTSAVTSGALGFAEAKSIVANLATELNNEAFGINVIGKLEQLLGPNGEDLTKDPLEIRTRMAKDSQRSVASQAANMQSVQDPMAVLGKAAMSTGAMAGAGALIASAIPIPVISTAAGAIAGTIAGIAVNAGSVTDAFTKMGTASGATVATGIMALQQQQEMLDSLNLEYERKIAIAQAAGDTVEAERLQNQLIVDRTKLLEQNKTTTKAVLDSYTKAGFSGQGAMGQAVDKAIETKYKDDPLMQQVAIGARDQIVSASGLDQTQEYQMKLMLATGDLDPLTAQNLINTFGGDSKTMTNVLDVMTNLGTAEGNQALQVMNMFVDENGNPKPQQQAQFMADLAVKSPAEASKYIDLFLNAKNLGNVVPLDVIMSFYQKNPEAAAAWQKQLDQINAVDGKMSMDFVQNLIGAEQFDIFKQNQEYFNSLDPVQQKTYMSAFTNTMQLEGDKDMQDAYKLWLKEPGNAKKMFEDFAVAKAVKVTKESVDATAKTTKAPPSTSGSGGKKEDPYEDILKRLKNVRSAAINAQGGLKTLLNLAGKGKEIRAFSGIDQLLTGKGINSQFVDYIKSADAKTQKLFVTFKNGKATLTATGQAMKKAFDEAILGEFQAKLNRGTADLKAQASGYKILQVAGATAAEAAEMTADAAFAAALANAKTKTEIARLINAQREYNKLKKEQEERDKRIAKLKSAQEGVQEANQGVVDQKALLAKMKADKSLTDAQKEALLSDTNLQTLYLNPTLDPVALQTALSNASNKAKLELDIKKLTISGLEDIFQDGFSKAMEAFSAKEKKIELDFEAKNKGDLDLVANTESKIAGINYKIDDYNAGLELIGEQEDEINKKYDAKSDALDKISKINDKIGRQAKQQLSVADALSQGDVAAAAKAIQDAKAQQAQDAMERQKEALDASRQADLKSLTTDVNGKKMSRVAIEQSIRDLEKEIFNLEEKSLEPARERLRLAEELKQSEIDRLTVLGKTKTEWEAIGNAVDVARTGSAPYQQAISNALSAAPDLIDKYDDPAPTETTPLPVDTTKVPTTPTPKPGTTSKPATTITTKKPATTTTTKKPATTTTTKKWAGVPYLPGVTTTTKKPTAISILLNQPTTKKPAVLGLNGGSYFVTAKPAATLLSPKATATAVTPNVRALLRASGGIIPNYLADGGTPKMFKAIGTDVIPSMLTPGEFVVSRQAVKDFGIDRLKSINSGTYSGDSVYNYDVNVNVQSDANPDQIARAVMSQIKQIDAQRIRSNRF